MAKKTEPTPEKVVEDFKNLTLSGKVEAFKDIQKNMDWEKSVKQQEINLLNSIDNEKK